MIILGIDLGKARTGVAVCDRAEMLASPCASFRSAQRTAFENSPAFQRAEGGANCFGPAGKIWMAPKEKAPKMPGSLALLQRIGLPVAFVDERGTTVTAHGYLNQTDVRGKKKRKAVVDSVMAVIILQNYLDYGRNCL